MNYLATLNVTTADKIEGYYIINSKSELDRVIANTTQYNKVMIRKDFAKEYFSPSGLNEYVKNVRTINKNIEVILDLNSNVLTEERFVRKLSDIRNTDEIINLISKYPKEFTTTVRMLAGQYEDGRRELLATASKLSRLQTIIDEKNVEIEDLKHAVKIETDNKLAAKSKLEVLTKRINYQYNSDIDEAELFSVDSNNYDKIIYIKEITRVQFVDSFVYYLAEILKVVHRMPARTVVIEGYYANGKPKLYPNLVPHHNLKERDVISGDILMLGMQSKLMKDILKNPSNISILIVLDRGGYVAPHIKGENVEYFYTASDLNDIPEGVPESRVISYEDKGQRLFIPLISGFESLDAGERIKKYSSTEIIKRMIALLEGR